MRNKLTIILIYLSALKLINLQVIPENPCPNIFKYVNIYGQVHGQVVVQNDNSGTYYLAINMSVASYLNNGQNIKINLLTSTNDIILGAPLVYNIQFPSPYAIPKPTRIEFNNIVYCSSFPEKLRPGGYVTNLWANTIFKITITHHGPDTNLQSPIDNFGIQFSPANIFPNQFSQASFVPTEPTSDFTITPATVKPTVNKPVNVDYNECGKASLFPIHLVISGDDVEEGQYPWLAAIMYKSGKHFQYRCTGSLVSDRHVITAGHCLQYGKAPLFPVEDLIAVFGTTSLENWISTGTIHGIREISTHPNYIEDSADNDVSVITLSKRIRYSKNIRPICMWTNERNNLEDIVNKEGVVAGWGSDRRQGEFSAKAKKINLPVVSQSVCLQSDVRFKSITSARTFCAGKRDNTGPCTGDDGSGFAMFKNGRWFLRGVISIPLKDSDACDLENYFVFADLAQIKGWLSTVLG
ncbi:hypothetical protein FQR65_LT11369 [Abscondita terminalis]|nr:hypothetical protein FQR65_LT11369 [Abscondita terminalis]